MCVYERKQAYLLRKLGPVWQWCCGNRRAVLARRGTARRYNTRTNKFLTGDLQDMRRRVETAALPPQATAQPASAVGKGSSKRVGVGSVGPGGKGAAQGRDTAA